MTLFKPPVNNKVTFETGEYDAEYAKVDGTTNTQFIVNKTDQSCNVQVIADQYEYMEGGPTTIKSFVRSTGYKQITMGTYAYGSVACEGSVNDTTNAPGAYIAAYCCDADLNYKGISINVDPTEQYIQIGYDTDEYYLLMEPATITLRGGHVPSYHGEFATTPTTLFTNGDEYYNTGDSKFYKYNGTDWIALN